MLVFKSLLCLLIGALVIAAVACGGDEPPAEAPAATSEPGPTVSADDTVASVDSAISAATAEALRKVFAGDCKVGPGAQCEGADFEGKNLDPYDPPGNRNFDGVDLSDANLRNADMSDVSMSLGILDGADLTDANLTLADDRGADFTGAIFCNTIMPKGETNNDDC